MAEKNKKIIKNKKKPKKIKIKKQNNTKNKIKTQINTKKSIKSKIQQKNLKTNTENQKKNRKTTSNYKKNKKSTKKAINKRAHSTNGNIRNTLKLGTWNKGPALFKNSIENVKFILEKHKLDILSVQELNVTTEDNLEILKIPNYTLIHDSLLESRGLARAGLFIHKDVNFTKRSDISNQEEAHVAVAVHLSKKKKKIVHAWYRQWQNIMNGKKIPATGTTVAQKERLRKTADLFLKSKALGETLILSDTNINTERIQVPESQKTSRDRQTSQVARILSSSILQEGFTPTNIAHTHKNSVIDHIFSNLPIKISNVNTSETHLSDHRLVTAFRSTKNPIRKPRYTTSRQYNKIDYFEMCQALNQDHRLYQIMQSDNTNEIAATLIQVIREHLDARAPKKIVQVTTMKTNPSETTKLIMTNRDLAYHEFTNNPTMDNNREYKHLRAQTKKSLIEDKKNQDRRRMEEATSSKDQWKEAKLLMGWMSYGGPKMIIKDGIQITSPQQMANQINMDYIVRAAKSARNTPPP